MRVITIVLLLSSTQAYAQSIYLSYSQWEQMPINLRGIYVAGAFDLLSTITTPENVGAARHYSECVGKVGMSSGQLAENMKEYAATQPDLQNKPAPFALLRYLISFCGRPGGATKE